MLIPLSWTVSEAVSMPERKGEKGKIEGGWRGRWRESVYRTETEKGLAANVQPVDHRDTWP